MSTLNKNEIEVINFQNLGFLGSGSNAQVRKAIYRNQKVAVKIFNQRSDPKSEAEYLKEVNELRRAKHENIVKLIAFGKWQDKMDVFNCMVIELADVGSLHHVLHETDLEYSLGHAVSWLKQCADAINYLHGKQPKPTIHRDLKPLNLLLMRGGTLLKVCDFGTACNLKTIMTVNKGSPCWIAPEQLSQDSYNEKCDVYSYSIVAWEVMVRLKPYFHLCDPNSTQIMFGVIRGNYRPKKVSKCPRVLELIYERGMDGQPSRRPSMQLILNIMEKLDSLINKTPIKPIVEPAPEELSPDYDRKHSRTETDDSMHSSDKSYKDTILRAGSQDLSKSSSKLSTEINEENFNHSPAQNANGSEFIYRFAPERGSFDPRNLPLSTSYQNTKANHRRSRSYGNELMDNMIQKSNQSKIDDNSKAEIMTELNHVIETLIYQPIGPYYQNNASISLFNEHRALIKEDELLQRSINTLRQQKDQLDATCRNINTYNELLKQKMLLSKENERLRGMLK